MGNIPAQLGLNRDETKAYNSMTAPETFVFNALPDNNAKIVYVRALVDRDRNWRERS
ncbi:31928_t:CDS:1, partial [Gigaspora margarita]